MATPVAGLTGVIAIAAGQDHAIALKTNGDVQGQLWGWGNNISHELGLELPATTATPIYAASDVRTIGAGYPVSLTVRIEAGLPGIWGAGQTSSATPARPRT